MSEKLLTETQAMSQLEGLFGTASISHPEINTQVEVISTGSLALDYAI